MIQLYLNTFIEQSITRQFYLSRIHKCVKLHEEKQSRYPGIKERRMDHFSPPLPVFPSASTCVYILIVNTILFIYSVWEQITTSAQYHETGWHATMTLVAYLLYEGWFAHGNPRWKWVRISFQKYIYILMYLQRLQI